MIHGCNARRWYINDYLVPQLIKQGLPHYIRWIDYQEEGNLRSFLNSVQFLIDYCGDRQYVWHIQDDVCLASDFGQRVRELEYNFDGIVCGFCCEKWNLGYLNKVGVTKAKNEWYSFPCIRIPNRYWKEFLEWYQKAKGKEKLRQLAKNGKGDDSFWVRFIQERHPDDECLNLVPSLVEHVDYLIGGSQVGKRQSGARRLAYYWEDEVALKVLENKLRFHVKQGSGQL